jgi:hypothetical protein
VAQVLFEGAHRKKVLWRSRIARARRARAPTSARWACAAPTATTPAPAPPRRRARGWPTGASSACSRAGRTPTAGVIPWSPVPRPPPRAWTPTAAPLDRRSASAHLEAARTTTLARPAAADRTRSASGSSPAVQAAIRRLRPAGRRAWGGPA